MFFKVPPPKETGVAGLPGLNVAAESAPALARATQRGQGALAKGTLPALTTARRHL